MPGLLFYIRLWRIWLHITKRIRKSRKRTCKSQRKKNKTQDEQNHFITSNALLSIETNAYYLIYLYLLVEQKLVPQSTANDIRLFSSQQFENVFRNSRALSGIYSTRTNFTMKQFLKRINKLNALTELKQSELTSKYGKIVFPTHHKIKQFTVQTDWNIDNKNIDFNSDNVETIIHQAYQVAQHMVVFVGMSSDLIENNLFNIEESSQLLEISLLYIFPYFLVMIVSSFSLFSL